MEKTRTINHLGKSIFCMDFSNTKSKQEIDTIIEESIKQIRNKPHGSLLAVTNMSNMYFNKDVATTFTSFVKENKPYIKKSAVYGMSGLARIVFNSIMKAAGRNIRSFETENQAKNFVIKS